MNWRIKRKKYAFTLQLTRKVNVIVNAKWYLIWPQSYMDYPDLSDQIVTQSNVK